MKKIISILLFVLLLSIFSGCKAEPPSKEAIAGAKSMLVDITLLINNTSKDLKKAKTGKATGEALIKYAKSLKLLNKKSEGLEKKYPDLKNAAQDKSLKPEIIKMRTAVSNLGFLFNDADKKYKKNKDFLSGKKKMKELMQSMKKK